MSASQKTAVLANVAWSQLPKRRVLRDLGVPKSTYYRWLRRQQQRHSLEDRPGRGVAPWNRLTPREEWAVLIAARRLTQLSCRQLAAWITDNHGFSVSESTVYRILGREGLVKPPEMQLKAGKEYHRKTTSPHRMWATDASYFKVIGLGLLLPGHGDGRLLPLRPVVVVGIDDAHGLDLHRRAMSAHTKNAHRPRPEGAFDDSVCRYRLKHGILYRAQFSILKIKTATHYTRVPPSLIGTSMGGQFS